MMGCKLMSLFRAVHCDDDRYLKAEQLAISSLRSQSATTNKVIFDEMKWKEMGSETMNR